MARSDLIWKIGTIGFGYGEWRSAFYPTGVRQGEQLGYYAAHFDTVELDTTFHAMPTPERIRGWAEQVDEGFRFNVKTPRLITHDGPPDERIELMKVFIEALEPMAGKLGRVLLQFPASLDPGQRGSLLRFLDSIKAPYPLAVELRHPGWFHDGTRSDLASRDITLVANDHSDRAQPVLITNSSLYCRFIGEHERFKKLNEEELDITERVTWWIRRIEQLAPTGATVWALFGNDYAGYAIASAKRLRGLLGIADQPRLFHSAQSLFGG